MEPRWWHNSNSYPAKIRPFPAAAQRSSPCALLGPVVKSHRPPEHPDITSKRWSSSLHPSQVWIQFSRNCSYLVTVLIPQQICIVHVVIWLVLWGIQISPTLLLSTLFTHWLGSRWSEWSASISCVSPGNMPNLDKSLAIVLPMCLFEICPISALTWSSASFRKHHALGMSCCSAALGHSDPGSSLSYSPFSNWKSVSVLHFASFPTTPCV